MTEFVRIFIKNSINNLVHLRIWAIIVQENVISSSWWDLNLSTKRAFGLVTLVLGRARATTWYHVALGSVLDLV